MTAWMVGTVVSKSATSWLIDTFMTDWSRTITNWAIASAMSAVFFIVGSPVGELGRDRCLPHGCPVM